jgi:hypothetical protein
MSWAEKFDNYMRAKEAQEQPQDPSAPPEVMPTGMEPTMAEEASAVVSGLPEHMGMTALNALQGATLAGFDEATSPFQFGRDWEQQRRQYNQQYPVAAGLAETGGGLLAGVAGVPSYLNLTANIPNRALRYGANLLGGGAAGATYGALGGETPEERMSGAQTEGALGVALPPALNLAGRVAGSLWQNVAGPVRRAFMSPEGEAAERLGETMGGQGFPADQAAIQARRLELDPLGNAPTINADLDPVARQTLKETYDAVSDSRPQVERLLNERQRSAPQRVQEDLATITGMDTNARKQLQLELEQSRREMARNNYGELYNQDIEVSDKLLDMFMGPEGNDLRSAYKTATDIAAREGDPIPPYNQVFDNETGTLEALPLKAVDYMQRVFRNRAGYNSSDIDHDMLSWRSLRERFLTAVDSQVPEFAEARRSYATQMSLQNAFEEGQRLYRIPDVEGYFSNLSGPEQRAFQRGAMDAIDNQIRNLGFKSGNIDTRLGGTLAKQEALDLVFGENADKVRQVLAREDTYNTTYSHILGGSSTTRNAGGALTPTPIPERGELTSRAAGKLEDITRDAVSGPSLQVYEQMMSMLLQEGYTEQQARQLARARMKDAAIQEWGRAGSVAGLPLGQQISNYFFGE